VRDYKIVIEDKRQKNGDEYGRKKLDSDGGKVKRIRNWERGRSKKRCWAKGKMEGRKMECESGKL